MEQKYGRMTILSTFKKNGRSYANCLCDCGNEVTTRLDGILSGHAKSCGCHKRDVQRKRCIERNTTHGKSKTRLYNTWAGIVQRCENPNAPAYRHYGGRGINMHKQWRDDFEAFEEWAFGIGYADDLTIERIDVNGDYEPGNCKWIPQSEQMGNLRRSHMLTYNGETKCLAHWARDLGVPRERIARRLRAGWSVEDALMREVVHK